MPSDFPPDAAKIESEIFEFFAANNFERSRRFAPGAYDPSALRNVLASYGNPQLQYETIHVAGTVGKGSITTYLSRLLTASGKKTGAYLSPHFVSLRERYLINASFIGDTELASLWNSIAGDARVRELSFFDALTLMAFRFFAQAHVDWAVVETGLGGRLDSTNNLAAQIAVITRIGLDHQNVLGNSIAEIAAEKAGIIRDGQRVFTVPQDSAAMKIIEDTCSKKKADLTVIYPPDTDFDLRNRFVAETIARDALGITQKLGGERIFGRFSELAHAPRIVFDGAHNADGAAALAALVNRQPESNCNFFLNTMAERDLASFATILQQRVEKKMKLFFFEMGDARYHEKPPLDFTAITDAAIQNKLATENSLHIFTGSMGIYAELRKRFSL